MHILLCTVKNTEKVQKKLTKVTTLREMGAEVGYGNRSSKTLYLSSIVLIFEPDEYITFSEKKFKSTDKKNKD